MKEIDNETMYEVQGGGINLGLLAGLSAFVSFVIGVIDGWTNPKKCN